MLTSAPFDNWWHNAYGLDVTIISPPHMLLAAGIFGCQLGAMLLALSVQNRATAAPAEMLPRAGAPSRLPALAYAYAGGLLLVIVSTLLLEKSEPNLQHGALFYELSCGAYPLILIGVARAARLRWAATTVAALYMAVRMIALWVLPLFPATPMLAPIYNPIHRMWPPFFPELLIVPAVACDLILQRWGGRGTSGPGAERQGAFRRAALALALGAAFFGLYLAAHWYFAEFMLSAHARNWFFAADQWTYRSRVGSWRHEFWPRGEPFQAATIVPALLLATVSSGLGLAWGDWMSRVRR
jgi:hypothetical protein